MLFGTSTPSDLILKIGTSGVLLDLRVITTKGEENSFKVSRIFLAVILVAAEGERNSWSCIASIGRLLTGVRLGRFDRRLKSRKSLISLKKNTS